MNIVANLLVFTLAGLMGVIASAQMVIQADHSVLQPQINRDTEGFKSCGMRALVSTFHSGYYQTYDLSLNIYADTLYGLMKAGKSSITKAALLAGTKKPIQTHLPAPVKFWIGKESEGKGFYPTKFIPAQNKGFVLGGGDFIIALETITAMMQGERIQFAIRYPNEPGDVVIAFSPSMPEHEIKPLLACVSGVIQRIKAAGEEDK